MDTPKHRHNALAAAIAAGMVWLAAAAPVAAQESAPSQDAVELDGVVVRGVRGAQASAINIKRDAVQVMDSVSAEDITCTASRLMLIALAWARSEERRVGKECRSRWSPYH